MKKFLNNIIIFSLVPLMILLLSDLYLRNKSSLYKEKYNGLIENKEKIRILILGNSHANYGVDPLAFDKYAFNIANVNQSFYFDKRITLKVLNDLKNLEYVLISADYHSLHFSSQGIRNAWSYYGNGIKYKDDKYFFEQLSPSLFAYSPKVILSYLKRDFINFTEYQGNGVEFPVQKGVDLLDTINQGFIGYSGTDRASFTKSNYKKRAENFNKKVLNNEEVLEIQKDMESFVEILIQKGVTPILYTTPTFSGYNKYLDSVLLSEEKIKYRKIADKYRIPFWDFMDSGLFNKEMFYDEDHLNKRGAFKFGSILNDSINKL